MAPEKFREQISEVRAPADRLSGNNGGIFLCEHCFVRIPDLYGRDRPFGDRGRIEYELRRKSTDSISDRDIIVFCCLFLC